MANITTFISEQLYLHVKEMDQISYGVLANAYVRQSLLYLSGYDYNSVNMLMYLTAYDMITDSIFTISQPFPDIDRVNVFTDNNIFFSSKRFDNTSEIIRNRLLLRKKPQEIATDEYSKFLLVPPHKNEWVENSDELVFSLQRIVQSSHGPIGIIEVQKKYKIISDICNTGNIDSGHVYVIDKKGNVIYPFDTYTINRINFFTKWYAENADNKSTTTFVTLYDDYSETRQVVTSQYSEYTDWLVIYTLPEKILTEPISRMLKLIIGIGVLGTLLSFGIAYVITSHVYTPLREFKKKVEKFDYQNFSNQLNDMNYTFSKSDAEIAVLNNTFDTMALKLKKSVDESMKTQSKIQKAYYKILQSQMNPHFLHNTISVISIMAKKIGDNKIPDICSKLNNLLIYTSDISEDHVTIGKEKENISSYLGLLKYRYEHRLEYFIDIDKELFDIQIPRMTLQPFVENSIKHGFYGVSGPLTIHVIGKHLDSGWEIIIKDNGIGIDETELSKITEEINCYNNSKTWLDDDPQFKVKGLGILNTFMRLKILFEDRFEFEIKNRIDGGTEIRIHVKK